MMKDEERELLETGSNDDFYDYCMCSKGLLNLRSCDCSFAIMCGLCSPVVVVVDTILLIPQVLINNIILCKF